MEGAAAGAAEGSVYSLARPVKGGKCSARKATGETWKAVGKSW